MNTAWYDRHAINVQDQRLLELARSQATQPPPEIYDVVGCALSAFERQIISSARHAIQGECDRLGAPRPLPTDDLTHVLDDAEFAAKLGAVGGKSFLRHVYLRRVRPPHLLLHDALHEFAHAVSYLAIDFVQVPRGADEPALSLRVRRNGLAFYGYHGDGRSTAYHGLDEGLTDILAHRSAKRLFEESDTTLSPGLRQQAAQYWSYLPAVCVAAELFEELGPTFGRPEDARDQLLRDYLTGSTDFLRALNRHCPGATRILAAMSPESASATATAYELGLDRALAKILSPGQNR